MKINEVIWVKVRTQILAKSRWWINLFLPLLGLVKMTLSSGKVKMPQTPNSWA